VSLPHPNLSTDTPSFGVVSKHIKGQIYGSETGETVTKVAMSIDNVGCGSESTF